MVEQALPSDRVGRGGQSSPDTELTERPHGVARQIQAGAARLPLGHPLDHFGRDSALMEGASQRKTGDTGSDDQHTQGGHELLPEAGVPACEQTVRIVRLFDLGRGVRK